MTDPSDRILIERLLVKLDNLREDVGEVKNRLPENLKVRLEVVEKETKSLGLWRNGIVAVGMFLGALITYGEKVFAMFKGVNH